MEVICGVPSGYSSHSCEVVGSCSEEGTVAIKKIGALLKDPQKNMSQLLLSSEKLESAVIVDYRCPLISICLDPLYESSISSFLLNV